MERRLAALMAADVVGYSARMAIDETATLARLATLRSNLEARIAEGGGRLFATAGDGFLVEFASPVAAVRTAFASLAGELNRGRSGEQGPRPPRIPAELVARQAYTKPWSAYGSPT